MGSPVSKIEGWKIHDFVAVITFTFLFSTFTFLPVHSSFFNTSLFKQDHISSLILGALLKIEDITALLPDDFGSFSTKSVQFEE